MNIRDIIHHLPNSDGRVDNEWVDDKQTILRMAFIGSWSWMHCFKALMDVYRLKRKPDEVICLICDLTESDRIPQGFWIVGKYEWIWDPKLWASSVNRIMVVGGGKTMTEIFAIRQQVSPNSMKYFKRAETMSEALALLDSWEIG